MAEIKYSPIDNPYGQYLVSVVKQALPQFNSSTEDVMEGVVEAILGNKSIRQGPRPKPEGLVKIREIVRKAVSENKSIPIISAAAAVKVLGKEGLSSQVDLAELMGLRTLACLDRRVKNIYAPGIKVNMRIEDITEQLLSPEVEGLQNIVDAYCQKFQDLVTVLGYSDWLTLKLESEMADTKTYLETAGQYAIGFKRYLSGQQSFPPPPWTNQIRPDQIEWFLARYTKLYGEEPRDAQLERLALYLAGTLTRSVLKASGVTEPSITISVSASALSSPTEARVFYRTIAGHNHIPWWYAKGAFRIKEDKAEIHLLNAYDKTPLTEGEMTLTEGSCSVTIAAPYHMEE